MTGPCPASPIAQFLDPAVSPSPVPSGQLRPQEGRYRAGSKTLQGEGIAGEVEPVVLERGGPLPTQANPLSRPLSATTCHRLVRAGRALPRPSQEWIQMLKALWASPAPHLSHPDPPWATGPMSQCQLGCPLLLPSWGPTWHGDCSQTCLQSMATGGRHITGRQQAASQESRPDLLAPHGVSYTSWA